MLVLGQDVGVNGGVFRATEGLLERFGEHRVRDTPLAELLICGASVGMAAQGLKPVCEIQFAGFIYPALDQLANHASRLRTRTRGRMTCPLVLRTPAGGGIHAPEHHSESIEAFLAHVPGIKCVTPSTPERAYGLLLSAIRDPRPGGVPGADAALPPRQGAGGGRREGPPPRAGLRRTRGRRRHPGLLGRGHVGEPGRRRPPRRRRSGRRAHRRREHQPPSMKTRCSARCARTGRLVVVHEAPYTGGFGAEVAARVAERALDRLLAPVERVTGFDTRDAAAEARTGLPPRRRAHRRGVAPRAGERLSRRPRRRTLHTVPAGIDTGENSP